MRGALVLLTLLPPLAAAAHPLDVGTARVSLRDQHLEVLAEVDLLALSAVDPTALATSDDATLQAAWDGLRHALEAGAHLGVDGLERPLTVTAFPSVAELRALAATLSAAGRAHGELARVRLECERPVVEARALSLVLPEALGPVLVTFVQPATRYTAAGRSASFEVLRRHVAETPRTGASLLAATALLALALSLVAGVLIGQRRPMR